MAGWCLKYGEAWRGVRSEETGRISRAGLAEYRKLSFSSQGYADSLTDLTNSTVLVQYNTVNGFGNVTVETYGNGLIIGREFDSNTGRLKPIDTADDLRAIKSLERLWE